MSGLQSRSLARVRSACALTVAIAAALALPAAASATTDAAQDGRGTSRAVAPGYNLTVKLTGAGTGRVTSSPAGIDCAGGSAPGCSAQLPGGSVVLTATPDPGSTFTGWDAAGCGAALTCRITLNAATTVTAAFALAPPAGTPPVPGAPTSGAPAPSDANVAHALKKAVTNPVFRPTRRSLAFGVRLSEAGRITYRLQLRYRNAGESQRAVLGQVTLTAPGAGQRRLELRLSGSSWRTLQRYPHGRLVLLSRFTRATNGHVVAVSRGVAPGHRPTG